MSARLSTLEDYQSLLDKYDTWMFDCDGVIWSGDRLIDGSVEVLKLLRTHSMFIRAYFHLNTLDRCVERQESRLCDKQCN